MSERTNVDDDEYFQPYAIYGTRTVFNMSLKLYNYLYITIMDAANSEQGKTIGMNLLWTFSKLCVYAERGGILLYNSNDYIKQGVDKCVSIKEWIEDLTSNKKIEPKINNWIHVCRVSNKGNSYSEIYDNLSDTMTETECVSKYQTSYLSVLNESDQYNDTCVFLKHNNLYCIRKCAGHDIKLDVEIPIKQSNCVPISIVYKHPDMTEDIDLLFLPNEMYCVNNILFSKAFVRRSLEYQEKPFAFDDRYTIDIIDSNVTMYTMTKNNYMKILVDEFKIISLDDAVNERKEPIGDSSSGDEDKSIDSINVCKEAIEYSSSGDEDQSIDYVDVCKEAIEYNSSSDEDRSNDSEYVYKQPFDIIDSSEEDKSINSINVCKKIVRDNSSSDEQQTQNDEECLDT